VAVADVGLGIVAFIGGGVTAVAPAALGPGLGVGASVFAGSRWASNAMKGLADIADATV
jgi:hypothetical protein